MAKKVIGYIGGALKSVVDVKSWVGYDHLKGQTSYLVRLIRAISQTSKPTYKETFEQAIARLNLDEKDIEKHKKNYLSCTYLYLCCAIGTLGYFLYLLWFAHFVAAILCFMVCALFGIKAIESHFHYFQIQHKKLDYTLKEWFVAVFLGISKNESKK